MFLCQSLNSDVTETSTVPLISVTPLPQAVSVCIRTLPVWLDRNSFFVRLKDLSQTERLTASNTKKHACIHSAMLSVS